MANLNKLNKIASEQSNWINEAKQRQDNKAWLKHSRKIAIKVLRILKEKGIKQKQLAEMMSVTPQQVNKIVKGKENLTLETISKIETVLNIKLIFENKTMVKEIVKKEYLTEKEFVYVPMVVVYKGESQSNEYNLVAV